MNTNITAVAVSSRRRVRRRIAALPAAVTTPPASAPTRIAALSGSPLVPAVKQDGDRDARQDAVGDRLGEQSGAAHHDEAPDRAAQDAHEHRRRGAVPHEVRLERLEQERFH